MADEVFEDPYTDTAEDILARTFSVIEDLYPDPNLRPGTREADLLWLMMAPLAQEVASQYASINSSLEQTYVQFAAGEYLDYLGSDRGVDRTAAVGSAGEVSFMGEDGTTIPLGTTVSTVAEGAEDEVYLFSTDVATGNVISGATETYLDDPTVAPTVGEALAEVVVVTEGSGAANEVQTITLHNATGGTFTITYSGQTTAAIDWNDTAADVELALEALSNIGVGDATVSGAAGGPYTIEFTAALALTNVATMTVDDSSLTSTGNISGDATYVYVHKTELADLYSGRGYTLPSPASSPALTVSAASVTVYVPPITWTPTDTNMDVSEVLIYRRYKSLSDVDFSEYKYVGSITVSPTSGGYFIDDVTDADFLLIDETAEATGGVPETNTTGLVTLSVACDDTGVLTNALAGEIQLLEDETPGVEAVTNLLDLEGGADEEDDETYRARILESARKSPGDGNVSDYSVWAKEVSGIYGVNVVPEWYGPGTVKVVISGSGNSEITDAALIEEVRQYIAGDIAITDPTQAELDTAGTLLTASNAGGAMAEEEYEYVITYVNEAGGETEPSPLLTDGVGTSITLGAGEDTVTITDLPEGPTGAGPTLCTRRRIYRSMNGGDFDLVTEIDDRATTTSYVDNTVQASLPDVSSPDGNTLVAKTAPVTNSTSTYTGLSPIGAQVTVETVTALDFFLTANVELEEGYALTDITGKVNVRTTLNEALDAFIQTLEPGEDIKYIDIQNVIHDTAGIADFNTVLLTVLPTYSAVTTNIVAADNSVFAFDSAQTAWTEV